jgi:hypothetical protein
MPLSPPHLLIALSSTFSSSREAAKQAALAKPVDSAGEMFSYVTSPRMLVLIESVFQSNEFARKFNCDVELRTALWKAGYTKHRSRPNLLKQETVSLGRVRVLL